MKVSPPSLFSCLCAIFSFPGRVHPDEKEEEEEEALTAIFTFRKKDSPPPFLPPWAKKEREKNKKKETILAGTASASRCLAWDIVEGRREEGGKKLAKSENWVD